MKTVHNRIAVKSPLSGPAMKAVVLFSAGIVTGAAVDVNSIAVAAALLAVLALTVVFNGRDNISSAFACLALLCTGIFVSVAQQDIDKPVSLPVSFYGKPAYAVGKVTGTPRFVDGNAYFTISADSITADDTVFTTPGLLSCAVYGRELHLAGGSTISLMGKIKRNRKLISRPSISALQGNSSHSVRLVAGNSDHFEISDINSHFFDSVRKRLSVSLDDYFSKENAAIIKAMILGERNDLSRETKAHITQAGMAHVLAVSGLHVGIIAIALHFLFGLLRFRRKTRSALTACCVVFFAGICGFRPPVTRAAIMILMVGGVLFFERPKNTENSLFVALLLILALDPQSLFGPSLQLSFAAVWGITTFHAPIHRPLKEAFHLNKVFAWILALLLLSVIATAATAPLIAIHFGEFPVYGIIANIIAVPLAMIIVPSGILSLIAIQLGTAAAPAAAATSAFTAYLLAGLKILSAFVSGLPHATVSVGEFSLFSAFVMAAFLFVLSRSKGRAGFRKASIYIPLLYFLVISWQPLFGTLSGNVKASVLFIDVGQGDAILVSSGGGRHFLIDSGPVYDNYDAGKSVVLPTLKRLGIDRLDGVFISHFHSDHCGGMDSVIHGIPTEKLYCRQSVADSLRGIFGNIVSPVAAGDSLSFQGGGILVMSPPDAKEAVGTASIDENDASLLLRFDMGGRRILCTGDMGRRSQLQSLSWGAALQSDILKVPHHGSAGLLSEFVECVGPAKSVVTCGIGNRYGHPSETTMHLLNDIGIETLRTDHDGTVLIALPLNEVYTF